MMRRDAVVEPVSELARLHGELESIDSESERLARVVASPAGSTIDELERALTRQKALELRRSAVAALVDAEQKRLAELKRADDERQALKLESEASQALERLAKSLVDCHEDALAVRALAQQASTLRRSPGGDLRGARIARSLESVLIAAWPKRFTVSGLGVLLDKGEDR